MNSSPPPDVWSAWLLHRRHANDPQFDRRVRTATARYADRVLDAARLSAGMTLVDLGAGDGLVGLRAIERTAGALRVLMTDISLPLLDAARARAAQAGVLASCEFLHCAADALAPIADATADAATARATLAYVADKAAALRECHRILRPGGRLSLAEPIFQDEALAASALRGAVAARPADSADDFLPLLHRWKAAQFPDTPERIAANPTVNFSERDLLSLVHGAGFRDVHVELHLDVTYGAVTCWDVFLDTAPHPLAPTLREILTRDFTGDEGARFERIMRPIVESGNAVTTDRIAYVSATKPPG